MKWRFPSLLAAVLMCVASLVGYSFLRTLVVEKSDEVADLQNRITAVQVATGQATSARTVLGQLSDEEVLVQNYFVPEANAVPFIDDLEARGHALGTTISVASVAASGSGTHAVLSLTLSMVGTFDAVMRTLGGIEYAPYDISIPAVALNSGQKNTWHANVTVVVGSLSGATTTPAHRVPLRVATSSAPARAATTTKTSP